MVKLRLAYKTCTYAISITISDVCVGAFRVLGFEIKKKHWQNSTRPLYYV